MISDGFLNPLSFIGLENNEILTFVMQFSFWGVVTFAFIALLVSFLHIMWYGENSFKGYLSLLVYVLVAVPLFLFAFEILPRVVFELGL